MSVRVKGVLWVRIFTQLSVISTALLAAYFFFFQLIGCHFGSLFKLESFSEFTMGELHRNYVNRFKVLIFAIVAYFPPLLSLTHVIALGFLPGEYKLPRRPTIKDPPGYRRSTWVRPVRRCPGEKGMATCAQQVCLEVSPMKEVWLGTCGYSHRDWANIPPPPHNVVVITALVLSFHCYLFSLRVESHSEGIREKK